MEPLKNTVAAAEAPFLISRPEKHVVVLTLNRPRSHNAVSTAMADGIHRFLLEMEANGEDRVGILTGAGASFCAGADLKEFAAGGDIRRERPGGFAGFVKTRRRKPWIAALNGSSWGGGTELLLACDMAVVSEAASLSLSEVKRGLVALGGGATRLARRIPKAVAVEILLTGEPLPARRAYELGLVNRVTPGEQVLAETIGLARNIVANSPFAVRETLSLVNLSLERTDEQMWEHATRTRERLHLSDDVREGPLAFAEKRKPNWKPV